ncbi:uncharacterized protein LOC118193639 isoform X2 [Stegodyphus dumicola]|uniref:uncharacterized protein LOC118193639 isoform X2 n=1 Tax=Stegodyphus dumicola TaxID=202533 RepID=UPI0015A8021E|nr:uncharacterized protein LOC118193639 isoform X2 [Stegodyphus dumicola]
MFEETLCSSSSLENNNACKSEEEEITCNEASAYVKEKEVTSRPLKHLLSLQWETAPESKYKKQIKRVRFANDSAENSSTETSEEVHEKIMSDSFVEVKDARASNDLNCVKDVQDSVDDYDSTKGTMELSSVGNSKNEDPCCYVAMKCEKLNINCRNDNFITGKTVNSIEEINGNVVESCGYFHNQSNILRSQKINNEVIPVPNKDESDFLTLDAVAQVNKKQDDMQSIAVSESNPEDAEVRKLCHKVSNEKNSKNALQQRSDKTFAGGKQSFRLNSLINTEDTKLCSATEIKSAIFKAWCKLKKDASNSKNVGNCLNASDKNEVLNKYKLQQLNNFCNFSDAAVKDIKISKKENLILSTKRDMVSFPISPNIHKQSSKVNSLLRDDNINVYNAFDLKSAAFDAWCKVKKNEFRTKSTVESVVNKQKEVMKRSISCGTHKLNKVQKKKKKHEAVLNSVTEQNTAKADDQESKMVMEKKEG